MRIRRKAAAGLQFTTKIFELLGGEASFKEGARVHAGRGVALEVDGVAFEFIGAATEEMIEADFIERGGGGEGGDVAADIVFDAIGAHDHGQRVPAHETFDAALEFLAAGIARLEAMRDGIGVRSVRGEGQVDAVDGGVGAETLKNFGGYFRTAGFEDGVE